MFKNQIASLQRVESAIIASEQTQFESILVQKQKASEKFMQERQ